MTEAAQARAQAGLALEDAAKRAHVCTSYLRAVEIRGGASYSLALRLARLYGSSANIFLYGRRDAHQSNHSRRQKQTKRVSREQNARA
jgi:hypothetical protein